MWPECNTAARTTLRSVRTEPSIGGDVGALSRVVPGASTVSDAQPVSANYYREKAEEIRHFERRCRFSEIGEELFELAERFDRMAAAVEKRRRINHASRSRFGHLEGAPEKAAAVNSPLRRSGAGLGEHIRRRPIRLGPAPQAGAMLNADYQQSVRPGEDRRRRAVTPRLPTPFGAISPEFRHTPARPSNRQYRMASSARMMRAPIEPDPNRRLWAQD